MTALVDKVGRGLILAFMMAGAGATTIQITKFRNRGPTVI